MARIEIKRSWQTSLSVDEARQRLNQFLEQQKMTVVSSDESEVVADQGSQSTAGLTGGWLADPASLPKRATVRLEPAEPGVHVEAIIEEALGPGQLDPHLQNRYEEYFAEWMNALRYVLPSGEPVSVGVRKEPSDAAWMPEARPGSGYAPQPAIPQQPYPPPVYAARPPKDRSVALILEILPGLFGFLGFGWIYSGNTQTGILWLAGLLMWTIAAVIIDVVTAGFGCLCTLPISLALIAISVSNLNTYIKNHPELFGVS